MRRTIIMAAGKEMLKTLDNYIIVDIGANLTNKKFSRDLDAVVQRAKDAGEEKLSSLTFHTLFMRRHTLTFMFISTF